MLARSFKQEAQFLRSNVMEHCEDIITINDLNFNYVDFNKAFLEFLEFKDESRLKNKTIKDVLTPECLHIVERQLQNVIDTHQTQTSTFRLINENSNKIIRQISTPIFENGEITGVLSISRDVTQEESLTLKLAEKVCRFNTLLEHIPILVYMKDTEGRYITGSKCAKDFVDYGFDSYANVQVEINESVEAADNNSVIKNRKILKKEIALSSSDGFEHWYKVCKAPIFDNDDNVNGVITIAQNIDFEKSLEAQKDLFLATLTHDLKNPLQAQLMTLKMFHQGVYGELNKEQKETLDLVIESATYMQDMLYSILTTYKCENGIIKLEKKEFFPDKLMNNCINEVKALANDKNVKLVYTNYYKDKKLCADEHQLRRVISNLVNNSINYAYNDTSIYINLKFSGDKVLFEFENTSDVIPYQMQECIFDKYVSGAKSYQKQGIGLGLYFCKKVVEAHNGTIYLTADKHQNKFTFEIPITLQDDKAAVKLL